MSFIQATFEMQRGSADEQVFEGKLDSFRFLLAFDAPGEPRGFERHRIDRHIARQPLDELQSPLLLLLRFGAIGSVD
jgi:hypothetical protein